MSTPKKLIGIILIAFSIGWPLTLPFTNLGRLIQLHFWPAEVINVPFLDNVSEENVLVFWGYVGCTTVCPVSLATLNNVYQTYQAEDPAASLRVIFVGLPLPGEQNSTQVVERYAQLFNDNFQGLSLNDRELSRSMREFGVTSLPSPAASDTLSHSGYIYLLRKTDRGWQMMHTYLDYPPDQTRILNDLRRLAEDENLASGDTALRVN